MIQGIDTLGTDEGRFKILNENQLMAPGKCAGCGRHSRAHFVDFGLELDFYGVVYLCLETCFVEVANKMGYLSPEQHAKMKEKLDANREENTRLRGNIEKLEAFQNAVHGLRDIVSVPDSSDDVPDSGSVHEEPREEGAGEQGSTPPQGDGGEQGLDESFEIVGLGDVPDDDVPDELTEFAKTFDL